MKVRYDIQDAAKKLGFSEKGKKLRKEQINPINSILEEKDTMVIYPTGFGKSAIMHIPALVRSPQLTLVFEPTVSLMYDQVQRLKAFGVNAEYMATRNQNEHGEIIKKVINKQVSILFIAPERLQSDHFQFIMEMNPPWLIVIDEAHCFVEWGRSFRKDYLKIPKFIRTLKKRPVLLAMTATAPEEYSDRLK